MSIANGLLLTAKDNRLNLSPAYIKATLDNFSIYKQHIAPSTWLFMFVDYSALLYNTDAESILEYTDARRDMLEITLRIQNMEGCAAENCPAYLRRDLLKWLRKNSD